jgi:hypothetical protein
MRARHVTGLDLSAARCLLMAVGVSEKHWPEEEMSVLAHRSDSAILAVVEETKGGRLCLGATQMLYSEPFPFEQLIPGSYEAWTKDGEIVSEVTLIAVDRRFRRPTSQSDMEKAMEVSDALVAEIYWESQRKGVTKLVALLEGWTHSFLRDVQQLDIRQVGDQFHHYWCGTDDHSKCNLTGVYEINPDRCASIWKKSRRAFWDKVVEDMNTP